MNERLKYAEEVLETYLPQHPGGVTMEQILGEFRPKGIRESELRAAIWTLRAAGRASFDQGKVYPAPVAA